MNNNYLSVLFSQIGWRNSCGKGTIKMYEKTYKLPILVSRDFLHLQKNIHKRQQLIKKRKHFKSDDFEQRFRELEKLIRDYNKVCQFLNHYQEAYQIFL